MFGKILTTILLMSCVACAKPRWAPSTNTPSTPADASNDRQESVGENAPAVACPLQFKSGLCLEWAWEKEPKDSEFGILVFKTYRVVNDQAALEDLSGTASVVLWMPSMGHGSSPTTVTRTEAGTYRVTRVYFVMPGAWDIHFQNKNADKVIDEAVQALIID